MTSLSEDPPTIYFPFLSTFFSGFVFLKTEFNFEVILPGCLVLVRYTMCPLWSTGMRFLTSETHSRGLELKDERKIPSNISRYRPGEGSRLIIRVR